jgi:hypothetical protein
MRWLLLVVLIGCGGGTFAPVTVTLDSQFNGLIGVEATKKLNPTCTTNCELGVAIEDGGCETVRVQDGGAICEGTGGIYLPDYKGSAPPYISSPRNIAVGAELLVFSSLSDSCRKTYSVPAGGLDVHVAAASDGGCSFTP